MLYDAGKGKPGTFIYYLEKLLNSVCGLDLELDYRGEYPHTWFLFPKRRPINTVFGAPIDFCYLKNHEPGVEAPQQIVDECHEIYLETLQKLYDNHKAEFGDEDKPLIFV